MPFVELITNVTLTRAQAEEVALSLSAFAAETLKKPESAFGINVRANEVLTFAGNWDPCTPFVHIAHDFMIYGLCMNVPQQLSTENRGD